MSAPDSPPDRAAAPDASDLCTSCGLCCDGTIFIQTVAFPRDLPGLAAHDVPVLRDGDALAFPQPCPRLSGTCCTIYPDRFRTCRSFRCEVLKKLDVGTIDLAKGLATIADARKLVAAVEPEARTLGGRVVQNRATAGWKEIADPAERIAMARRHVAIVALELFLNTHFRRPAPDGVKRED